MSRRDPRLDAIAGVLAAAVALGVGELIAAILQGQSMVIAVGDIFVDYTPGAVVKAAIDALGENDKPALIATVTAGSLAVGALLGPVAGKRDAVGVLAFTVFGAVGALALTRDPLTSGAVAVVIAGSGAIAGFVALRQLLDAAGPKADRAEVVTPGRGVADRRQFLAFAAGATGTAAASAFTGRVLLGPRVDVEEQRQSVVLPPVDGPAAASVGLDVQGLTPLIVPNSEFYRIDTALVVPQVDVSSWRLKITGMVDTPYELTFEELTAMEAVEDSITLACVSNEVGGDLVGNAIWRGIPLTAVLERAGVQPGATQIVGRSVDGFTVGFPTELALDGRTSMVAVGMNGEALPAEHGFPARLIVPGLYGYVSATKWLAEIELTTWEAFDAYWVPRGWAKEGPIKTQSRIDVPRGGSTVSAGRVAVAGVAWGGIRSISKVEVRIWPTGDDPTDDWHEARLSEALSNSSWRQWVLEWDAHEGDYRLEVRATDGEGDTQTEERARTDPDGATGWHRTSVKVR